jgi:aminoglycoside phosphotransferase (APT) family kinase protein
MTATIAAEQIESLLGVTGVTDVTRVFGGNARRAWTFHAGEIDGIVLAQVEPGQLECDPDREFRVLRGLHGAGVRAPAALAVDARGEVLGFPSVVLERMPGTGSVTAFLKPEDPALSRSLTEDLARAAAELHGADAAPTLLEATDPIDYWEQLFRGARYEPHAVLCSIYRWLRLQRPANERPAVVHGDFRPGNFLHEAGRITALLDWEMAHLGDPAEDIAWAYRPLWGPEAFLPLDAFVDIYNAHARMPVTREQVTYWQVFSEAKFATISLRAARAFHDGVSTNLRLADRAAMVTECLARALELIGHA